MLRIGICDDENNARDALRIQLEKILEEDTEEIVYEFSSGNIALHWLKNHTGELDLLFLDVEMNGLSGIETANEIRQFDPNILIVFVTGFPDFVFEGYRVQALDYLIKPVEPKLLLEVLNRVRSSLTSSKSKQFSFQNSDGYYRLYLTDILYFYSDRRKVIVVTNTKEIAYYAKLDEVEQHLNSHFVRIHQRYLVNADAVTQIKSDSVIIAGTELPISRALKGSATTALAKSLLALEEFS